MENTVVRWRKVENYPEYKVSDIGEVFSTRRNKVLKATPNADGYRRVTLSARGKSRQVNVAILVLETFHSARPEGKEACHRDTNALNDKANNLYWGTHKENMQDSARIGKMNRGRLTMLQANDIRARNRDGERQVDLAIEYGVTKQNIHHIVHGHTLKC